MLAGAASKWHRPLPLAELLPQLQIDAIPLRASYHVHQYPIRKCMMSNQQIPRQSAWTRLKSSFVADFSKEPKAPHRLSGIISSVLVLGLIAVGFVYIHLAYPKIEFRLPGSVTEAALAEGGNAAGSLAIWNLWWTATAVMLTLLITSLSDTRLNRMKNRIAAERLKQPVNMLLGAVFVLPFLYLTDMAGLNHGAEISLQTSIVAADAVEQVVPAGTDYDKAAFLALVNRLVASDVYQIVEYEELPDTYHDWVSRNEAETSGSTP